MNSSQNQDTTGTPKGRQRASDDDSAFFCKLQERAQCKGCAAYQHHCTTKAAIGASFDKRVMLVQFLYPDRYGAVNNPLRTGDGQNPSAQSR